MVQTKTIPLISQRSWILWKVLLNFYFLFSLDGNLYSSNEIYRYKTALENQSSLPIFGTKLGTCTLRRTRGISLLSLTNIWTRGKYNSPEDFVTHYCSSRPVFEEILNRIGNELMRSYGGGVEEISAHKQYIDFTDVTWLGGSLCQSPSFRSSYPKRVFVYIVLPVSRWQKRNQR